MNVRNADFRAFVGEIFNRAPFIAHLGVEVVSIEAGIVRSALTPRPEHLQQDGFVHTGVVSTLADHTAGAAACTLIEATQIILTSEFKIHLLRPANGRLECTATVLKPGRMFSIVEAEVRASGALVAKLIATLAVVDKR